MESRIPSESECFELLAELGVDAVVVNHSIAVKNAALRFADSLEAKGVSVDRPLLTAAALLHDMLKFDAELCHCLEAGDFLRKRGLHSVAAVVEKHGLQNLENASFVPKTPEEKILMYADLRVLKGGLVSLDERFAYIKQRYKPDDSKFVGYVDFAKNLEKELGVR